MPFIGYKRLGEIVGKTEDEIRIEKEAGTIDLDDFEGLVRYVASYWGWGPLSELQSQVRTLREDYEKLIARKPASAHKEEVPEQLDEGDLPHETTRWKVEDRDGPSPDPYLDRIRNHRGGRNG